MYIFQWKIKESLFSVFLSAETHNTHNKKNQIFVWTRNERGLYFVSYTLLNSILEDNKVHGSSFMCISDWANQDMDMLGYKNENSIFVFLCFKQWVKVP